MSMDPAVFVGRVDEAGTVHLVHAHRQKAYCKAKLAGKDVDVIIVAHGEMKTRLQEQGFHAMITPWARSEGIAIERLKHDLLAEVFGMEEHVNRITGEVRLELRQPHTSQLSRTQYSELIERSVDIAADCGYLLELPHEYRERQAREARKAAKQATAVLVAR